jgi:quercetin dioxygenase-like cupin family protein
MRRAMTPLDDVGSSPTVLGPSDGDILGDAEGVLDRFMVEGDRTAGRFALVEHRLAPRALAAPLHFHTKEDEYSFILEGDVGAYLGGTELVAHAGDLVAKPRGQWHTFWNAGESTARVLEIISPAGLEELFRLLDTSPDSYEPEKLTALAEAYGAKVDFDGTLPIIERYGLRF